MYFLDSTNPNSLSFPSLNSNWFRVHFLIFNKVFTQVANLIWIHWIIHNDWIIHLRIHINQYLITAPPWMMSTQWHKCHWSTSKPSDNSYISGTPFLACPSAFMTSFTMPNFVSPALFLFFFITCIHSLSLKVCVKHTICMYCWECINWISILFKLTDQCSQPCQNIHIKFIFNYYRLSCSGRTSSIIAQKYILHWRINFEDNSMHCLIESVYHGLLALRGPTFWLIHSQLKAWSLDVHIS